jgi:hypothetical protein
MTWDFSAWERGDRLLIHLTGDDRWLEAVYLGPARDASPRVDRQMFAVDDGESWKLVMARNIGAIRSLPSKNRVPAR